MTTRTAATAAAVAACAVLAGCATSFQGSYLVGERFFKTRIDTQPVVILSVDGRDTTQRRVLVEPGEREIRVQAMPVPGAPGETRTFRLDVQPCFTYFIVAVRENRLAADFTPVVDFAQPVGGCAPPAATR
jgi:hypothetical protein